LSFNSSIRGPSKKPNPSVGKGDKSSSNKTGEIFNLYGRHEGKGNSASGDYSHAEGFNTRSSGNRSHAEGTNTLASGDNSHAEGTKTSAIGANSHAEGGSTKTIGAFSHASGWDTTAKGLASYAEGWKTASNGIASHSEGICTIAEDSCQTVIGKYNNPIKRAYNDNNEKHTLLIIGNGDKTHRSNIVEVTDNDVAIYGDVSIYLLNDNGEIQPVSISSLMNEITNLHHKIDELTNIISSLGKTNSEQ
jgi:hypothetical protein